jgi:hypothetical protein
MREMCRKTKEARDKEERDRKERRTVDKEIRRERGKANGR